MQQKSMGVWLASASERRAEILLEMLKGVPVWFAHSALIGEETPVPTGIVVEEMVSHITNEKANTAKLEVSLGRIEQLSWHWMGNNDCENPKSKDAGINSRTIMKGGNTSKPAVIVKSPPPPTSIENVIVIVADTLVADPDDAFSALGQPADELSAAGMLIRLSGRRHLVWSGTTLFGAFVRDGVESATVEIAELSESNLEYLLNSGSWKGKAGAYDLAGEMASNAKLVAGDELAVLGFASQVLSELMEKLETICHSSGSYSATKSL
jgi:predicted house-cleaning NTP pyrophosphatase (Maf/HAM1 superfamily)